MYSTMIAVILVRIDVPNVCISGALHMAGGCNLLLVRQTSKGIMLSD